MTIKVIKAKPGKIVNFPGSKNKSGKYPILPETPTPVEWPGKESYWVRRLQEGVIEVVESAPSTVTEATKKKGA